MSKEIKAKACKQCGVIKLPSSYKLINKHTGTTSRICKHCESINAAYRRLKAKQNQGIPITDEQTEFYTTITSWYELLKRKGLEPAVPGEMNPYNYKSSKYILYAIKDITYDMQRAKQLTEYWFKLTCEELGTYAVTDLIEQLYPLFTAFYNIYTAECEDLHKRIYSLGEDYTIFMPPETIHS